MPHLSHCHECDKPFTPNYQFRGDGLVAICDACVEPKTADEHNTKPHYRVYETMRSKEPIAIGYWDFERKALINVETGKTIPDHKYLVTERMNGTN